MGQNTSGMHAILSNSHVYDLLQNLMGAHKLRKQLVKNYIRPFSGMSVFDIGCGTAEILRYLPEDIFYYGCDINQEYINSARNRYKKRGVFFQSTFDTSMLKSLPKFDLILLFGVLHHLGDHEVKEVAYLSKDVLKGKGRLISIDPCFVENQNILARYLISNDRGSNVRTPKGYEDLIADVFGSVEGVVQPQRWIPYTHWIMEAKI